MSESSGGGGKIIRKQQIPEGIREFQPVPMKLIDGELPKGELPPGKPGERKHDPIAQDFLDRLLGGGFEYFHVHKHEKDGVPHFVVIGIGKAGEPLPTNSREST